ncbi:MAG: metal-dependent phosphoesterase [Gammaproteobacteria bacterium]|nr:MAG: metal-dependent phosphoesterase [Gammaproteobacteria bacterium]
MIFDLHMHSRASDGTLAPAEVVKLAAACGVDVMALTDHDATDGVAEARAEAGQLGVGFVAGVEVSVTWNGRLLHIIGLGIDERHPDLQQGLAGLREARRARASKMAEKLERSGIPDALARVGEYANGPVISRTHFARFLVDAGYVATPEQAFRRYLRRGKRAYVPMQWAPLEQAIGWINGAGGTAVIAHPLRYGLGPQRLRAMVADFKACGGEAIEVIGSGHDPSEYQRLARLANEFGLLASCGSDFHDPAGRVLPGRYPALPDDCVTIHERVHASLAAAARGVAQHTSRPAA